MSTSSTRKGVRLTLPGAPDAEHTIAGLPGVVVYPSKVTVLETDEQVAQAEEIAAGPDAPIEVVSADKDIEPWRGYSDKSATDIVKRLERSSPEEAAAVIAFENQQSNPRSTVLDAAAARISTEEA